jgi:VanZ family protein
MTRRSLPFAALAVVYLGVIGVIALGPTLWRTLPNRGDYDVLSPSVWVDPETWVRLGSPEFVANILLFVPLGLLVRLAVPRAGWIGAAVTGGAVSIAIEVLQMWSPRVSDPRDVVANTLGAAAGALLAVVVSAVARRTQRSLARPELVLAAERPPAG